MHFLETVGNDCAEQRFTEDHFAAENSLFSVVGGCPSAHPDNDLTAKRPMSIYGSAFSRASGEIAHRSFEQPTIPVT